MRTKHGSVRKIIPKSWQDQWQDVKDALKDGPVKVTKLPRKKYPTS